MRKNFKEWLDLNEARLGWIFAEASFLANEGRNDPEILQKRKPLQRRSSLFDDDDDDTEADAKNRSERHKDIIDPAAGEGDACEITPLSGYAKHIQAIQSYAMASPENFAQVLIFSPLSANVGFAKHWDNFHVLMMILKHNFPDKVTKKELEHAVDSFPDYLHNLAMTIHGWKLDTVAYVWSNRESMMSRLTALAKDDDDEKLLHELVKIPGVQAVKAGFIAQLLFGRAGCIDVHNIDIYKKAYPELSKDLNANNWTKKDSVGKYVKTLRNLKDKGIGTSELWDVWVDFVENFYRLVSSTGMGAYTDMGSAIENPDDSKFDALRNLKIPKVGATTSVKADVQPISGRYGMGASATHLQLDPDDALGQFHKMYKQGQQGSDAARAIPFRTDKRTGLPVGKEFGLGTEPSLLKYFGKAYRGGEVDPDAARDIIKKRLDKGGKKKAKAIQKNAQGSLF